MASRLSYVRQASENIFSVVDKSIKMLQSGEGGTEGRRDGHVFLGLVV